MLLIASGSEAALGEYCGKTPIYRVEEPSNSELARLGPEAREDPSSNSPHFMNHLMEASLLAGRSFALSTCIRGKGLLADANCLMLSGPGPPATREIFHVWSPPASPRIQDPKVQDASRIFLLRIGYALGSEATQRQSREKGFIQEGQ